MRLRKARYRKEPMADINMTNLIDIVMVLLIVFILVANFVQTGLNINLPQVSYVETTGKERIVIGIDATNLITLNSVEIAKADLPARLAELREEFPDESVFVNADKMALHGEVAAIYAAAKAAGFSEVNVPAEYFEEGS